MSLSFFPSFLRSTPAGATAALAASCACLMVVSATVSATPAWAQEEDPWLSEITQQLDEVNRQLEEGDQPSSSESAVPAAPSSQVSEPSAAPSTSASTAPATPAEPPAPAAPLNTERLGALLGQMSGVAHEVAAKNEEVKELEDELEQAEEALARAQRQAQRAGDKADRAQQQQLSQQETVNAVALARYRGQSRGAVRGALGATDPAAAVDRLGYLGALNQRAQRAIEDMATTATEAAISRQRARETVAEVTLSRDELARRRDELSVQRAELEAQQRSIEAQVNALDGTQRAAWAAQWGTVDGSQIPTDTTGVVAAALSRQGSPYGWGHTGPASFDCSGLMVWAYQQVGKTIPRTSQAQLALGTPVPLDRLQPGDLIGYFPGVTHVGMYIGNGQVVHAATYGVPVQVVRIDSMPIQGAVRF